MRDASLDEFLNEDAGTKEGNEDGEDGETNGEGTDESADADTDADADAGAEPAVSTYDWSPGGTACEGCGAVVERRWRDGEQLVCGECKEW